jgi:Fuc2NAc and GlcNAc transferase
MRMIYLLPLFFIGAYLFTFLFLQYALCHKLQDIPNERSSHQIPIPRGGGLSIVLCVSGGVLLMINQKLLDQNWGFLFLIPGALIALLGFVDDYGSVSARVRLVFQFVISIPAVVIIFLILRTWNWTFFISLTTIFFVFYLVWMTNLYNFMDGIDGLAACQCASVAGVLGALALLNGAIDLGSVYLLLFSASMGFLMWNWPPAKIFMGDVGSGYLGFCFAFLSLWGEVTQQIPCVTSMILMGVFIVDATYTLFQRVIRKQPIFQAHRDHAYQKKVRLGWRHSKVTLVTVCINLFWLTPWAWMSLHFFRFRWVLLIFAYIPLLLNAHHQKAGIPEK